VAAGCYLVFGKDIIFATPLVGPYQLIVIVCSYDNAIVHVGEDYAFMPKENARIDITLHKTTILESIAKLRKPIVPSLFQAMKTFIEFQDIGLAILSVWCFKTNG
jgi:hypothetical protein